MILQREICIFPGGRSGEDQARVVLEVVERPLLARGEEGLCEWESNLKTQRATLREGASCHERFQEGWSSYF